MLQNGLLLHNISWVDMSKHLLLGLLLASSLLKRQHGCHLKKTLSLEHATQLVGSSTEEAPLPVHSNYLIIYCLYNFKEGTCESWKFCELPSFIQEGMFQLEGNSASKNHFIVMLFGAVSWGRAVSLYLMDVHLVDIRITTGLNPYGRHRDLCILHFMITSSYCISSLFFFQVDMTVQHRLLRKWMTECWICIAKVSGVVWYIGYTY